MKLLVWLVSKAWPRNCNRTEAIFGVKLLLQRELGAEGNKRLVGLEGAEGLARGPSGLLSPFQLMVQDVEHAQCILCSAGRKRQS